MKVQLLFLNLISEKTLAFNCLISTLNVAAGLVMPWPVLLKTSRLARTLPAVVCGQANIASARRFYQVEPVLYKKDRFTKFNL